MDEDVVLHLEKDRGMRVADERGTIWVGEENVQMMLEGFRGKIHLKRGRRDEFHAANAVDELGRPLEVSMDIIFIRRCLVKGWFAPVLLQGVPESLDAVIFRNATGKHIPQNDMKRARKTGLFVSHRLVTKRLCGDSKEATNRMPNPSHGVSPSKLIVAYIA